MGRRLIGTPQHASRAVDYVCESAKSPTEVLPLLHRNSKMTENNMTSWDQVSTRASRWAKLGEFGCNRALQPGILVASTNLETVGMTSASQQKKRLGQDHGRRCDSLVAKWPREVLGSGILLGPEWPRRCTACTRPSDW